jgi:sulfur-oxidizing protein SoxA
MVLGPDRIDRGSWPVPKYEKLKPSNLRRKNMSCKRMLGIPLALAGALTMSTAVIADSYRAPEDVLRELIDETGSKYLSQSQQNLMMMADNPASWTAEEGEELFYEQRGPNNVSLEGCDFGLGPGVLDGAYVQLPRYFDDAGRVMDFESRLVYCMTTLQGFSKSDPQVKKRHGSGSDIMKLTTFIASKSSGYPWNPPLQHPQEIALRDAGEVLFNRRAGPMDFSCATCHTGEGLRIRASVLPNVNNPKEWTKAISWPAFRVGHDNVRSTQHRVRGCYWQMRQGLSSHGSDGALAIISYWTDAARGEPAILPDMKR